MLEFNDQVSKGDIMKKHYIPMAFYACLCIFSLIAVVAHLAGSRTFMTLELSKSFILQKIDAVQPLLNKICVVTFIVGVLRGLSALAILKHRFFYFPVGFTIVSIIAVIVKMTIEFNGLYIVKLVAYLTILAILIADRKNFGKKQEN